MDVNTELYAPLGAGRGLVPSGEAIYQRDKLAVTLERIAFYGVLGLIALVAIPYGGVEPWWTALANCLVFVLASLRIVEASLRRDWWIAGVGMMIPLLALCVFAGLQILPLGASQLNTIASGNAWRTISVDPFETRRFVFRLLAALLAGELLMRYTSSRRRLAAVVGVVIGVGVLSACFGFVRQMAQTSPEGFILPKLPIGEGYGQFINRNHFALLMEMSLGLLLGLLIGQSRLRSRFLPYLSLALVVWVALVSTNSRGGVISMFGLILCVAISHLAIQRWRSSKRHELQARSWMARYGSIAAMSGVLAMSLVLLTAIGVVWVGGDPVVSRMETVSSELGKESNGKVERKEIWHATWQLIKAHPFAGIGFGGYETAIPEFYDNFSGGQSLRQAHNDYLEILASGGIIAAVLVVWFLIVMARKIVAQLQVRSSFRYSTCLGALAGLFAVSIHSFFDFGLHITVNALVFTCLVVIATANCISQPTMSSEEGAVTVSGV
ncbi:MAG: O-antigen ligase family protein [Pyrinomonadaceae bacterium]